jgi:uncharacterized protein
LEFNAEFCIAKQSFALNSSRQNKIDKRLPLITQKNQKKMSQIDFDKLWKIVLSNKERIHSKVHGPAHWARVERNGVYLCQQNGADEEVIRLFALFHDSMRLDDDRDPEHGLRGAEYAKSLLNQEYELPSDKFELLYEACENHSRGRSTDNKTIGTCWDADRLDLRRVNIRPLPNFMHSNEAKCIIKEGKWKQLEKLEKRTSVGGILDILRFMSW